MTIMNQRGCYFNLSEDNLRKKLEVAVKLIQVLVLNSRYGADFILSFSVSIFLISTLLLISLVSLNS